MRTSMLTRQQIQFIRTLHTPRGIHKQGVFLAEGEKLVQTLLENGSTPEMLIATSEVAPTSMHGHSPVITSPDTMARLSTHQSPPRLLGVFPIPTPEPLPLAENTTLVLEAVQDPGNLGTIIRTADWFGIRQIICSPDCALAYAPKAIHATMGAIASVRVVYTPLIPLLRNTTPPPSAVATTLDGNPIGESHLTQPCVILLGNEGHGLSDELLTCATHRVTIPHCGTPAVESLNVASVAAIMCAKLAQTLG